MKDGPQPRASAEYSWDQKNPLFRKELKKLIEGGVPRSLARPVARSIVNKAKVAYSND